MTTFSLCIHVLSAVVIIINSLILFVPALLTTLLSAMFDGNGIGLAMIAMGAAMLAAGVFIFKAGVTGAHLIQTDAQLYRSQEIRAYLLAAAIAALCLLVLFVFNSFSVNEVFKYGFGFELIANALLLVLNLIGLALMLAKTP